MPIIIKTLALKDLKPNPDNPRIIKDEQYKKLIQSLKDLPKILGEEYRKV